MKVLSEIKNKKWWLHYIILAIAIIVWIYYNFNNLNLNPYFVGGLFAVLVIGDLSLHKILGLK
jgi:hypothetical protein